MVSWGKGLPKAPLPAVQGSLAREASGPSKEQAQALCLGVCPCYPLLPGSLWQHGKDLPGPAVLMEVLPVGQWGEGLLSTASLPTGAQCLDFSDYKVSSLPKGLGCSALSDLDLHYNSLQALKRVTLRPCLATSQMWPSLAIFPTAGALLRTSVSMFDLREHQVCIWIVRKAPGPD